MKHVVANFLTRLANFIDGSGWDYDEFTHGYSEGLKARIRRDFCVLPREPTRAMLEAAAQSMSPAAREGKEWVSNRVKHKIRYQSMIDAYTAFTTTPKQGTGE